MNQQQVLQIIVPLAVILVVMAVRARQLGRLRPLKLGLLWLRPAILVVLTGLALVMPQPGHLVHHFLPTDWVILALAAVLGVAVGWQVGRTMKIEVHPENGTLMVRSSPVGLLVLVGLVAIRMGVRTGVGLEARAWHLDATLVIDALIVFSTALFTLRSLEMYLRAKKKLSEHQLRRPVA